MTNILFLIDSIHNSEIKWYFRFNVNRMKAFQLVPVFDDEHQLTVVSFKGITGWWQMNVTVKRHLSEIEEMAVGKSCS